MAGKNGLAEPDAESIKNTIPRTTGYLQWDVRQTREAARASPSERKPRAEYQEALPEDTLCVRRIRENHYADDSDAYRQHNAVFETHGLAQILAHF